MENKNMAKYSEIRIVRLTYQRSIKRNITNRLDWERIKENCYCKAELSK